MLEAQQRTTIATYPGGLVGGENFLFRERPDFAELHTSSGIEAFDYSPCPWQMAENTKRQSHKPVSARTKS